MTSKIAPRVQRTSFVSSCGGAGSAARAASPHGRSARCCTGRSSDRARARRTRRDTRCGRRSRGRHDRARARSGTRPRARGYEPHDGIISGAEHDLPARECLGEPLRGDRLQAAQTHQPENVSRSNQCLPPGSGSAARAASSFSSTTLVGQRHEDVRACRGRRRPSGSRTRGSAWLRNVFHVSSQASRWSWWKS